MDDSRRSSCSAKPSAAAAKFTSSDFQRMDRCAGGMVSEEIKENGQQLRGVVLGSRNLKKEHKSFMWTTTYAAPRKKILAEKNDAPPSECSGTYSEGNPEVKKPDQIHGHPDAAPQVASFPSGLHIYRSVEETVVSSETQPYDPLTNYLSPRPKFLRYNPNRRREIYVGRQRELKGKEPSSGSDLSGSSEADSASSEGAPSDPTASSAVRQEGLDMKSLLDKETSENVDEAEDDGTVDEEVEEEEGPSWCNLVWKVLLLIGALFLSTYYISSVHPSPAVCPLHSFLFSKANLFKIQDSYREVAVDVGINLNKLAGGTYMNTCMQGQFSDLANWGTGISSHRLDGLLKYGDFGYERLQEEEANVKSMWADGVISGTNLVVVEEESNGSEESQDESEQTITEGGGMLIGYIPVVEGEIEECAGYSKETQYDGEMVKAEDFFKIEGENEDSLDFVKVLDLEHENGFTGAVTHEQHSEDVIMESEREETEQLSGPASPRKESLSDDGGEDTGEVWSFDQGMNHENKWDTDSSPSCPQTVEDADAFRFNNMKLFTTILMVITVAASTTIGLLHFRRTSKASAEDSSASFPISGIAADGTDSSKVHKIEMMGDMDSNVPVSADKYEETFEEHCPTVKLVGGRGDKGINLLVGREEVRESHPPSCVELVEETFVDPVLNAARHKDPYERNPPAVKLLGEFSIAEQGMSENKNSSLRKKTIRIEGQRLPPQEMSTRKSLPFVGEANQISPVLLTPESASCRTPAQEESLTKQRSGRGQEAEKVAASTPVRRSSRIRNRVTSPGA